MFLLSQFKVQLAVKLMQRSDYLGIKFTAAPENIKRHEARPG
jgi:hypothetical protein